MQHTQLLSARKDNAAVAGGRRACLVAGLTPCSESVSCRPSAGMGGTCEGDAAVGLDLLLVSETSWHLSWRPSLPRTRSTTPTPRDYSCKSEKKKKKNTFSFCSQSAGKRQGRPEQWGQSSLPRHLMLHSWHQGPPKDSSGLWKQPAAHRVQRFKKFQGRSQEGVTLWRATRSLKKKPSKYLGMLIIDSANLTDSRNVL